MLLNIIALLLTAAPLLVTAVTNDTDQYTFDAVYPDFKQIELAVPQKLLQPGLPDAKIYSVATITQDNWFVAQQVCGFHGLSLASINSEEEGQRLQKFITQNGLSGHEFWLSGTVLARQDKWLWFNIGRPLSYSNWEAGRPSNAAGNSCMALLANGKWRDVPCYSQRYFICETRCELDSYQVPIYRKRR